MGRKYPDQARFPNLDGPRGGEMSSGPDLACAVLSLGGDPRLVGAVRSLQEQSVKAEIVVVNSGGGSPEAALHSAGIDVPVVDHPVRLFPGGVRNLGIDATRAPYISFLAADCRAERGWVAGRLAAHRKGAAAVATVMSPLSLRTRSECASLLLVHPGRLAGTPPAYRRLHGLSYERSLFERYGRFREDLRAGEDSDFNSRLWDRERVVWSSDVRTAHHYPTTPWALLCDEYRRGQRRTIVERELRRMGTLGIVTRLFSRLPLRLRIALRTLDPVQRRKLLRSWPLLLPGAIVYAAGVLSAGPELRRTAEIARSASLTRAPDGRGAAEPQPLADLAW
jgi:hypothetical protein